MEEDIGARVIELLRSIDSKLDRLDTLQARLDAVEMKLGEVLTQIAFTTMAITMKG